MRKFAVFTQSGPGAAGLQRPLLGGVRCQPQLRRSVRVYRDKPARCERVQVSDSEGLATHAGPESCAGAGNGVSEALTGECAGRVLSPEIGPVLDADALRTRERPYCHPRFGEG